MTVAYVLMTVVLWLLSNLNRNAPRHTAPFVLAILITQAFNTAITVADEDLARVSPLMHQHVIPRQLLLCPFPPE
ncbi:MAG: hypothetical protein JO071_04915 [Deltaproteobacteria bacterium]|nr:hypothetical protein [Deltaproteobacteria bacterium]